MKKTPSLLPYVLCVGAMALSSGLRAGTGEFVTVSATAAKDYVRAIGSDGTPRPETYIVSKGVFFDGSTKDAGLEKTAFIDVAANVGRALLRQNYFPAKDPQLADLLLIMHWGTTTVYEDGIKDFKAQDMNNALASYNAAVAAAANGGPSPDSSELNSMLAGRDTDTMSMNSFTAYNAKLLGYETVLRNRAKELAVSTDEVTFRNDLAEERYFVVVQAFDYQGLKKEHKKRLLWTTRMSVRAPGTNFKTALPELSQMAAGCFGKQLDDLQRTEVGAKEGTVKIGEAKVVTESAPVSSPSAKK